MEGVRVPHRDPHAPRMLKKQQLDDRAGTALAPRGERRLRRMPDAPAGTTARPGRAPIRSPFGSSVPRSRSPGWWRRCGWRWRATGARAPKHACRCPARTPYRTDDPSAGRRVAITAGLLVPFAGCCRWRAIPSRPSSSWRCCCEGWGPAGRRPPSYRGRHRGDLHYAFGTVLGVRSAGAWLMGPIDGLISRLRIALQLGNARRLLRRRAHRAPSFGIASRHRAGGHHRRCSALDLRDAAGHRQSSCSPASTTARCTAALPPRSW